ncbi:MAG TPA: tol-pal system-associated acyl-CoA thioesterase [Rickettsiales bacterium]|nr:tol-pal system-associated acyl-CoA thioesterase [Rickettsiales bacterium]
MTKTFEFKTRVYYADTDAGGVVYHSTYLDFCEKGRTELLREKGIIQTKLKSDFGITFVVKSLKIDYKKSAKLDDLLIVKTQIVENTGIILKMNQEIFNENNDNISSVQVEIVCLNKDLKPIRIPKDICEVLC